MLGPKTSQGRFGTDDGQIHLILPGKLVQGVEIIQVQYDIFAVGCRAGVSGSDKDALDLGAL